jgi:hypothetical protein
LSIKKGGSTSLGTPARLYLALANYSAGLKLKAYRTVKNERFIQILQSIRHLKNLGGVRIKIAVYLTS